MTIEKLQDLIKDTISYTHGKESDFQNVPTAYLTEIEEALWDAYNEKIIADRAPHGTTPTYPYTLNNPWYIHTSTPYYRYDVTYTNDKEPK